MDILGNWYNELNSKMEITSVSGGEFRGTYTTGVGGVPDNIPFVGLTDTDSGGRGLGFVVCWPPSFASVTSWSGQAQTINGEDLIIAFWLLTKEEDDPQKDWAATQIGQDVFTRHPQSEKDIAKESKTLRRSHP